MDCNRKCSLGCSCAALVISAVFAAVVGVLFYFRYISFIVTAVWIAFGLGVLILILLFASLVYAATHPCWILPGCLCARGGCLLLGSVGTVVSALAALSIALSPRLIFDVILVSVGAFFTALMLLALIALLLCIICALCGRGDQ